MNKITPFLWFGSHAEDAVAFYLGIFKNSKTIGVMPGPDDKPFGVTFEIEGQRIIAFNGGSQFKLNEALSLMINCDDQAEVDYYWEKLGDGGEIQACGWLKDKFGLSWQITPKALMTMMSDPDREKAGRAMQAMLQMTKIEIAKIEEAFNG